MKRLLKILFIIIAVVIVIALLGFFLPKQVHVERSANIHAAPATVYALTNNLKTYDQWMPWNRIDPDMKKQYAEQTTGAGAWYTWDSKNKNVGKGKLTIAESIPDTKVVTMLEFDGFDASEGGWLISPAANGTNITWYMNNNMGNNPVGRWMGLFMDKMIGPDFEKGLESLKQVAESSEQK